MAVRYWRLLVFVALLAAALARPAAARPTNDPLASYQYALDAIGAFGAWEITTGSPDVLVAVIDSGVNAAHPDLAGRVLPGRNFIIGGDAADDVAGHGTQLAGIIAAAGDNGTGIAGLCWQCRILPIKVIGALGQISDTGIAQGIRWAVERGARVINLSLGGSQASPVVHAAIQDAVRQQALVIAAAGNDAERGNPVAYPAAYDEVLAVAATDAQDRRLAFSAAHTYVDVSAPGWNIATTGHAADRAAYGAGNGTSYAAAYVSGLAALLLSINPALDGAALRAIIMETADDLGKRGVDREYGAGRIHAARAVARVRAAAFAPTRDPRLPDVVFVPETQHTLRGRFRQFWEQNGGQTTFGWPISEELRETSAEGTFTVQYFERTQFELHPGVPAPRDIQLARLGVVLLRRQGQDWGQLPKGKPAPGCRWFAETVHSLCEPFLSYWQRHGLPTPDGSSTERSLERFGLPLSEPLVATDGSGRRMLLQWFERARLELPDGGGTQVVLGALGVEAARFDAAQASRSGHTPPRCAALPPATAATMQPAGCILPGTEIVIEATGFQPKERVVGAVTGPDGLNFPLAPMQADARGRISGLNRRMDAPTGLWSVNMRGARSSREAVVYVRIVDR